MTLHRHRFQWLILGRHDTRGLLRALVTQPATTFRQMRTLLEQAAKNLPDAPDGPPRKVKQEEELIDRDSENA